MSMNLEIAPGVFLDVDNPDVSLITPRTIGHNLSRINRFAGVPERSISVAEHSWHGSYLIPTWDCVTVQAAARRRLAFLFHDAPEGCGLNDIMSPVKKRMDGYRVTEDRLMTAIADFFGFWKDIGHPSIKDVDRKLGTTEKIAFLGRGGLERPEWEEYSLHGAYRFSFVPRWLDNLIHRKGSMEKTIYYHWLMWPNRARSLWIKRARELGRIAFPESDYWKSV